MESQHSKFSSEPATEDPNDPSFLNPQRKTSFSQQRFRVDISSAESAKAFGGIDRVTDRHDILVQTFGDLFVVIGAGIVEYFGCISGEGVRPQVAVVTSRVAVTRKDVAELWRTMTHHDLVGHAHLG